MLSIIVCRGLPASGKSTWAKQQLEKHPSQYKRLNRDDLRSMIDNGAWSKAREKHIRQAELTLAEYFLSQGFSVIVDDTNLSPSSQEMWLELSRKLHVSHLIQDFTYVDVETCIERDRKRPNYVGEQVIRRMYRDYLEPKRPTIEYNHDLPDALIVDLDGTLALMNGRNPYDASLCEGDRLNTPVASLVTRYSDTHAIILVSGRQEIHRPQTERWLKTNTIPYSSLYMRSTGDQRKDFIVKQEIYEREIKDKYNVLMCLDDRRQVVNFWRSQGLTCLQVDDGDF